ncbi:MAG: hypothetical protein AAGI63_14985 [Planctomycetota bacterium]
MRYPLLIVTFAAFVSAATADPPKNFTDEQLVAWCIVPFDSKDRSPAERAEMLDRLGLKRVAYDWRAKHIDSFEEEITQYQKHGIEYFAFWGRHDKAFELFKKYDLHPQIWMMLPQPEGATQTDKVRRAAEQLLSTVKKTKNLGLRLGIYNHGGWSGEPENMVAVCEYLREHHEGDHVGIVYNFHHGHLHVDRLGAVIQQMKPYLLCINLNGMTHKGDERGKKILPLGEGEQDVDLLQTVIASGYTGPVGIIGHTQDDVELRLRDNLDGLHWLLPQTQGEPASKKPTWRTYRP